ncbi:MAG: RNA polymerase sigma factor RpoH [Burkholderiales bacterium]|jgi:RNA polymerase sigma-32 factor|tara:strand:+ start:960 stop:1823 length:864 start_codon:yes stop_codon:yes gene_type:complete
MTNTFSLSKYNVTDSFDLYQREIRAFPSLTAEEEFELGTKLKLNNDLEAAKKLILSHLKLVIKIARSYSGYGLPVSDLVQEGNVGLMKAVKKFNVDKGVRLVSYAIFWIKAEIQEYVVKNWRLVKNATTKAQRKLFFNLRSMKKTLKPLSIDEIQSIANDLNVKESDVKEMEYRMNGQELTIDYSDDDSDEDSFRPISYLEDKSLNPHDALDESQTESNNLELLKNAMTTLDQRSESIIKARWLSEDKAKTLNHLAKKFNVSAERIRQIEKIAMDKLKTTMSKERLD